MNNQSFKRADRPDAAAFKVFIGFVLLVAGVCVAVWTYWCFTGQAYFGGGKTSREQTEGAVCAMVSLILFGFAAFLFARAFSARGRKPIFAAVDPHTIPLPPNRIEIVETQFQKIALAAVGIFFGLLTALNFYQTLNSSFSSTREIIIKGAFCVFTLALIFILIFLTIRAKRRSVKWLDASGVTRGDGRHFAWTDFCGTVTQTARRRFGGLYVWRKELTFTNGETAWLIPSRIKNAAEVFQYVERLPIAAPKS